MNDTFKGLPVTRARVEHIFPKLTPAQINRIAARGYMREIHTGEVLVEQGDSDVPFFVVDSGEIEIVVHAAPLRPLSPYMVLGSSLVKSICSQDAGLFSCTRH